MEEGTGRQLFRGTGRQRLGKNRKESFRRNSWATFSILIEQEGRVQETGRQPSGGTGSQRSGRGSIEEGHVCQR